MPALEHLEHAAADLGAYLQRWANAWREFGEIGPDDSRCRQLALATRQTTERLLYWRRRGILLRDMPMEATLPLQAMLTEGSFHETVEGLSRWRGVTFAQLTRALTAFRDKAVAQMAEVV